MPNTVLTLTAKQIVARIEKHCTLIKHLRYRLKRLSKFKNASHIVGESYSLFIGKKDRSKTSRVWR